MPQNIVVTRSHSEGETRFGEGDVVVGVPDAKAGDRILCDLARSASDEDVTAAGADVIVYVEPIGYGIGGAPEPAPVKRRRRKPTVADGAKPARRPRKPKAAEPA